MTTIPILLYHSVSDDPPDRIRRFAVSPATFARHLDLLAERGCSALTVSGLCDAIDGGCLPARPVAVTFDDGWADVHGDALPVLAERAMAATIYLTTGAVGTDPQFLSWSQVGELAATGFEVGSHTRSHPQLDVVAHDVVVDEVRRSRAELEARLERPIRSFAYPHGYSTRSVRDAVAAAGHDSACAVKHALSAPGDDRLALARLMVRPGTGVDVLERWLDGRGLAVAPPTTRLRVSAWRACRRLRARVTR